MPSRETFDESKPVRGFPEVPVEPVDENVTDAREPVEPDPVAVEEDLTEIPEIEIKGTPEALKDGDVTLNIAGLPEAIVLPKSGASVKAPASVLEAIKYSPVVQLAGDDN